VKSAKQRKRPDRHAAKRAVAPTSLLSVRQSPKLLMVLLLLAATIGVYGSVAHNSFVNFDDDDYLFGTPEVHQAFTWNQVRWAFSTFDEANWHPLTWLSYIVDYQCFQATPSGVHIENVLIHGLTACVLFLLLESATGCAWRSGVVGALYALHPLNVESVAWAAERKNVLSMLFFALALWAYTEYAQRKSITRYLAVVTAFALALMAKPQVTTFPFVLLLWDVWPLGLWRNSKTPGSRLVLLKQLIGDKIPLLALSGASCVLTYRAHLVGRAVRNSEQFPFTLRFENAMVSYAKYLGKALWPSHLAVIYPYPVHGVPAWQFIVASIALLAVSMLVWFTRSRPYMAVGWFWFLGTLVPMIGLVQVGVAAMADRYACLPLVGLFLMLTWGGADWAGEHGVSATPLFGATAGVLLVFSAISYRQAGYWRNSETLWTHALSVTTDNFVAHDNLGASLASQQRSEEAIGHFRAAVAIEPKDWLAHLHIGHYELRHENYVQAVEHLGAALGYMDSPQWRVVGLSDLGSAYLNLDDYARARENFRAALSLNPSDSAAEVGMGLIAQHDKNLPQAIQWYSQTFISGPNDVACLLLANALEKNGQHEESRQAFEEAQRLTTDLDASQQRVAKMLARLN
jgi:protein O-mannosyl-transferase